jgi:hypothetical protein
MHLELFISVFHPCLGQVHFALLLSSATFGIGKKKNVEGEKVGRVIDRKKNVVK